MKIPIKTFEQMNEGERREYLEGLLDDGNLSFAEVTEIVQALRASEEFQTWKPEADGIPSAYTPQQVAKAWNVSTEFVRLLFANEPGVLRFNKTGKSNKKAREYTTIRIPKPVMLRVFKKWQKITRRIK